MASNLASMVRNLHQRKGRKRHRLVLAEGIRLVEEALAAGLEIQGAIIAPSLPKTERGAALLSALAAHAVPLEELGQRAFATLAETETPQGILAVVTPRQWTLADLEPHRRGPVLVLDAVQDPGNVGTLLRTAFALGAAGSILLPGTADVTNPKVTRAAMGATFRLPAPSADDAAFAHWVSEREVRLWAAASEGTPVGRLAIPERLALVVGNEGGGIRAEILGLAADRVAIPLARGAESLNVAVAAGILLHEVTRAS